MEIGAMLDELREKALKDRNIWQELMDLSLIHIFSRIWRETETGEKRKPESGSDL